MRRIIKKLTPEEAADLGKKWKQLYEDTLSLAVETSQYLPKASVAFRKCDVLTKTIRIAHGAVDDELDIWR